MKIHPQGARKTDSGQAVLDRSWQLVKLQLVVLLVGLQRHTELGHGTRDKALHIVFAPQHIG